MQENDKPVLIYATFPTPEAAAAVGNELVEARLAACVNIIPGMTSIYRWEGKIARDSEAVMVIKTRRSLAEAAIAAARQRHPYTTPRSSSFRWTAARPIIWAGSCRRRQRSRGPQLTGSAGSVGAAEAQQQIVARCAGALAPLSSRDCRSNGARLCGVGAVTRLGRGRVRIERGGRHACAARSPRPSWRPARSARQPWSGSARRSPCGPAAARLRRPWSPPA